ncbi:acetolactate decarboxylase [Fructobacillus sp. M2-14]|uniref:Alpha-acetolactate decarboxylase n=1 Tax=Fructobacillus broussonetiae TaxID=2713173 RepID=A0ABS5QY83_9LACO|nr:acetolactate decarboxylase [Fructobacillus broussonetiae]MBS9338155.1 acetolactate decarboxylase [Fructobacillus broussonetiae]
MNQVVQFGTMQMLVESLLDGFVSTKDVLSAGDYGIGTGEGVDGELVIIDGVAYQIDGEGQVHEVGPDFPIAFGNVHKGDFQFLNEFENITLKELQEEILKAVKTTSLFFAFKIEGDFDAVQTRSANKSSRPWPSLSKIAEGQNVFDAKNVGGTMVGYFSPKLFQGAAVPFYHQHFLSNEHNFGGHVLSAKLKHVKVSVQMLSGLDLRLPADNADYRAADLNQLDHLNGAIKAAES